MNFHATNASGERQRAGAVVAWTTSRAGPQAASKAPAVGTCLRGELFYWWLRRSLRAAGFNCAPGISPPRSKARTSPQTPVSLSMPSCAGRLNRRDSYSLMSRQARGAVIRLSDQRELRRGVYHHPRRQDGGVRNDLEPRFLSAGRGGQRTGRRAQDTRRTDISTGSEQPGRDPARSSR